ncbi:MAG: hypothetical protein ACYDBB_21795 [Armatimonadota bacterium]
MRSLLVLLAAICLLPALAAPQAGTLDASLVNDSAAAKAAFAKSLAGGKCFARDPSQRATTGTVLQGSSATQLPPGRYRLHVPLALAPLGNVKISAIAITLKAEDSKRTLGMLNFTKADEFIDATADFTIDHTRFARYSVDWMFTGEHAKRNAQHALDVPDAPGAGDDQLLDITEGVDEDEQGFVRIADLSEIPFHLAAAPPYIEQLSPVAVKVATDKIVYKPGEMGTVTVSLANGTDKAVKVTLEPEILAGLAGNEKLPGGVVEIAVGESKSWSGTFTTQGMHWGAEIHVSAKTGNAPVATGRAFFGVTDNFWETAIVGGMMFSAHYREPEAAEKFMQGLKDQGFTVLESGFWAPDEFGNFTPDTELFYGGQGCYPGSVTGTKNVITAGHKRGMASTVYSNLWGGDGYDSYEMIRQHPDWFTDGGGACSDWLENWELMSKGKIAPMPVWPYTCVDSDHDAETMKVHAQEFVNSHKTLGWDGTRYDSYGIDAWSKRATKMVRELVEAQVPEYRWGYNSSVPKDADPTALDVMCRGGQLVMEEGLRGVAKRVGSFTTYCTTLSGYRDVVWSHDGHLGLCYDRPGGPLAKDATVLDAVYLCSILLATGCHPYYSQMDTEIGKYPAFALRYSEYLYDHKMRKLATPEAVIKFGGSPKLLEWPRLVRTLDMGNNRRRLVIQLLNTPANDKTISNPAMLTLPPIRNLPVTVTLPPGAVVQGAWSLCAIPDAHHDALETKRQGDALTLTVPEVRIWNVLVIEFTAKEGLQ